MGALDKILSGVRSDKINLPEGTGATIGAAGAGALGTHIAKKRIPLPDLGKAIMDWRTTQNAMPMMKLYGKRVIPVALIAAALGALGGSKIQRKIEE